MIPNNLSLGASLSFRVSAAQQFLGHLHFMILWLPILGALMAHTDLSKKFPKIFTFHSEWLKKKLFKEAKVMTDISKY